MTSGGVSMAQATDTFAQLFGPPRLPPKPSAWDLIVGIDLDHWMRADSPEQIEWLAWLRDHPMPEPEPPECSCEQVEIRSYDSRVVRHVPGRPDPACEVHPPCTCPWRITVPDGGDDDIIPGRRDPACRAH